MREKNITNCHVKTFLSIATLIAVLSLSGYIFKYKIIDPLNQQTFTRIKSLFSYFKNEDTFVENYPDIVVTSLWNSYRTTIQDDGRTIDRGRGYLTTSEAQSYTMLRAVWMDDKDIFDKAYKWTKNNLQVREEDDLFAWRWGQLSDDDWGIPLEDGGMNTASDADQDIALALIFAYKRWDDEYYLNEALKVLDDIWQIEVMYVNEKPYLVAGNWAKDEDFPTINPSYFSFGAYPIFAEVDPSHDWSALKDTSYEVLNQATSLPLDNDSSANLPPDWVHIDKDTSEILAVLHEDKTTDFDDDAYRTVWRVGLDWKWHGDPRAKEYLDKLDILMTEWDTYNQIFGSYSHNGNPTVDVESNSMYGAIIPYYQIVHPERANEIYRKKLASLYNSSTESFAYRLGYYDANWVWFGMAFYEDKVPNLYAMEN